MATWEVIEQNQVGENLGGDSGWGGVSRTNPIPCTILPKGGLVHQKDGLISSLPFPSLFLRGNFIFCLGFCSLPVSIILGCENFFLLLFALVPCFRVLRQKLGLNPVTVIHLAVFEEANRQCLKLLTRPHISPSSGSTGTHGIMHRRILN